MQNQNSGSSPIFRSGSKLRKVGLCVEHTMQYPRKFEKVQTLLCRNSQNKSCLKYAKWRLRGLFFAKAEVYENRLVFVIFMLNKLLERLFSQIYLKTRSRTDFLNFWKTMKTAQNLGQNGPKCSGLNGANIFLHHSVRSIPSKVFLRTPQTLCSSNKKTIAKRSILKPLENEKM